VISKECALSAPNFETSRKPVTFRMSWSLAAGGDVAGELLGW
jgi:hypothetical protein